MTKSPAAYQSDAQKKEQAAVQAYAAAYPAPWLFVNDHLEIDISAPQPPEVRLIVYPPAAPLNVGEVAVMVGATIGATAITSGMTKGEAFHVAAEAHIELPVDRVGHLIAEIIVARPGVVDLAKIPNWAKAATIEALTPHREHIKQAQDVLRGKVK